ncbi:MAG: type I-C CRISPR-associated protein Cas8c/Csd1 [Oscillospiraceae bacterium]|nr:type I-C CRISPR-associated protein Cas8c/Csd1 [Oscillospiraceae bacterium]
MGLLASTYRTYERNADLAGVKEADKQPLAPISHIFANAQIEITLTREGAFTDARSVSKEEQKTIIPATIESANRVGPGAKLCPHPLCDYLWFLAPSMNPQGYEIYLNNLRAWAQSPFTHPAVHAVLKYVEGGSILKDLAENPAIKTADKSFVRWRIVDAERAESKGSYEDARLFRCFSDYYGTILANRPRKLCLLTGLEDTECHAHPKGVFSFNGNAKLISANDQSGFTYRGRFADEKQAGSVGYLASQKAHNALRWLVDNESRIIGGRAFLCWNPEGESRFATTLFGFKTQEKQDFQSYRKELRDTLNGYRDGLSGLNSHVVIAALDAATTGRLSVTYYNELSGSDFLDRIQNWYESFCVETGVGTISPSLRQVVNCACGTQQGDLLKTDDKVMRQQFQSLLDCMVCGGPIPADISAALVHRAGKPLAYSKANREYVLTAACAVVRKRHNDSKKKEEYFMALDEGNKDKSYLYGRLLAIAEQAERSTYPTGEDRETNAIRMQQVFSQRPAYAWGIIEQRLNPYYQKMTPGLRSYYKNMVGEILDSFDAKDKGLNLPLDDVYLLGYYHQRKAFFTKKEKNTDNNEEEK